MSAAHILVDRFNLQKEAASPEGLEAWVTSATEAVRKTKIRIAKASSQIEKEKIQSGLGEWHSFFQVLRTKVPEFAIRTEHLCPVIRDLLDVAP